MFIEKKHILFSLCAALFACASCTIWNTRDWQGLSDKKFYFQRFNYSYLGANRELAMATMRESRLREALDLAEKKYGISIDTSEFEQFIAEGDTRALAEKGIFMGKEYEWLSQGKKSNAVEFEYYVKTDDIEFGGYNFRLIIKTDGRTRAFLSGTVKESAKVYPALASQLGGVISPQPKAAKAGISSKTAAGASGRRKFEAEGRIKDQIDSYMQGLSADDRTKFRDEMLRFLKGTGK